MAEKIVQVAVGVLQNNGDIFVQKRKSSQPCPGCWEFPGGKINNGESPQNALRRELKEELGIAAELLQPWLVRVHHYPHATVRLHFFRVCSWREKIIGHEGQQWRWTKNAPDNLLAANIDVWKWLRLPPVCAITAARLMGAENATAALEKKLQSGLRLVQLRDKTLPPAKRAAMAKKMRALCKQYGALLLVNDDDESDKLARDINSDGVHLSSRRLAVCDSRPPFVWVGASCHNDGEIKKAATIGADFAVLSPLKKTLTHADSPPLGWARFRNLAQTAGIPVYALGGMRAADLQTARQNNGQGIAMMREAWR